jgi:hypothetical protein
MKKYFICLLVGITLLSCTKDKFPERKKFVGKTFDHIFYETEQDCIDSQTDPNFFINCHQELTFNNNNSEIMLTDIIYTANYSVKNNRIFIHANSETLEFPNDLIFEIINTSSLKLISDNTIWNERIGNTPWN